MACAIALAVLLVATHPAKAPAIQEPPLSLVNPFIGTQDSGNTFPGATVPFGMVQLSPDNGGKAGYDHDNTRIDGFSHTHLSGVGCGALGEVRVMPTTGAVASSDPRSFGSHYAHDTETARPGYYAVDLTKYGVRAELSATTRTGWHRYSFPPTARANVLFDVGRANMPVRSSSIQVIGDRTLEGSVQAGGFCGSSDRHRVYFSARFDRPFAHTGTWRGGRLTPGGRQSAAGAGPNGAWVRFDTTAGRSVGLQVGISYASLGGARRNLAAEADGKSFDEVAGQASGRWASMLDRAKVAGGSPDGRVAFTTALYHAFLHPNVIGDVDGAYPAMDGKVRVATDHTPMGNLSLWDTFRTQNQLLELLAPEVSRDVALSILADARAGSWLPRWSLAGSETNVMTGDSVTPFLVENWSAGLLAGHEQEAYRALRANALRRPPARSPANGRAGIRSYARRGYIAVGTDCPRKGSDSDCRRPASATLEYAAADASLALMARALGHGGDARLFARRSLSFRTLWNRRARLFLPRGRDGRWRPSDVRAFHEGSPAAVPLARPAGPRRTRPPAGRTARGEPRARSLLRVPGAAARPGGRRAPAVGRAPARLLRGRDVQPEQRARPARPVPVRVDGPAVEDGDRGARGRDAVPQRARRHDGQRRSRHRVGLVRAERARSLSHHERRRLLRREHAAVPVRRAEAGRGRLAPGRDAHHRRAGHHRGPALHRRGEPERPAGPADVAHARRDRARRAAVVPRVGAPDALGHGGLGGAAVGRPRALNPTRSPRALTLRPWAAP